MAAFCCSLSCELPLAAFLQRRIHAFLDFAGGMGTSGKHLRPPVGIALCTRHGKQYDGKSYWIKRRLDWLGALDFGNGVLNEVLQKYLVLYYQAQEKVDVYDQRIEDLSQSKSRQDPVEKPGCFMG